MRKLLIFVMLIQFSSCEFFDFPIDPPSTDTGTTGQSSITCGNSSNGSNPECVEGAGTFVTTNFDLSGFEKVELDFCGNIRLSQGPFGVSTSVQSNILPAIDLTVEDNTLLIRLADNSCISVNERIFFDVSAPTISEIKNSSSGDIELIGVWENIESLSLIIDGAGDFQVEETWSVESLRIQQEGVGNVLGFSPVAAETNVELNGIGRVETTTTDLITGAIAGPGTLYYKGTPTIDVDLQSITSSIVDAN